MIMLAKTGVFFYFNFMESRIGWLGNSSPEDKIPQMPDERLISVDTYTGEVVRMTPEQFAQIKAYQLSESELYEELVKWGGFASIEEAEDFLDELSATPSEATK
jgi:putative heme iron utilization protein